MINISVLDVAKATGGILIGNPDVYINGVSIDSREIRANNLYIPIIGENNDGHTFIKDVIKKKASCFLFQKDHERPLDIRVPYIIVQNTTKALQDLASYYIKTINPFVIAITGSNGKTSAKDMMCSIMSCKYKTAKTLGNHNNEIGVPLSILGFDSDIKCAVIEMGVEHEHDINFLSSIVRPNVSLITSLGSAHISHFKHGIKDIAKAKLEIYSNLTSGGYMFYNGESQELDEELENILEDHKDAYAFGKGTGLYIDGDIKYDRGYTRFSCSMLHKEVAIKVLGKHQATNALGCIGIALKEGISEKDIISALKKTEFADMRCKVIKIKDAYIIDDSYKSNPESAKAAIDSLNEFDGLKKIVCLGDMLDLGSKEIKLHKQIGEYIKSINNIDKVVCYGELSEYIAKINDGEFFTDKQDCIKFLSKYLKRRAVILVKGSRALNMDEIVSALKGDK